MELLRIVSMLLIVVHHSVLHGLQLKECTYTDIFWFTGGVGVNCFVFISGYYMVKSRITLRKMLRLWVTVWIYYIVFYALFQWSGQGWDGDVRSVKYLLTPLLNQTYWFVSYYALLMLLSPFLNHFLLGLTKQGMVRFVATLLLMQVVIFGGTNFPLSNFMWFAFLYCLAACIRLHGQKLCAWNPLRWWGAAGALVVLIVAAACLKGETAFLSRPMAEKAVCYFFVAKNSICSFLCSLFLFLGFACWRVGTLRRINIISACALGVYLLHEYPSERQWLWNSLFHVGEMENSPWFIPYCLVATLLVYLACTLVEWLRQATLGRLYDYGAPRWILPPAYRAWGVVRRGVDKFAARI